MKNNKTIVCPICRAKTTNKKTVIVTAVHLTI